jgi:hypothetical protein
LEQVTNDHTPVLETTRSTLGTEATQKLGRILDRLDSHGHWLAIAKYKQQKWRGEKLYGLEQTIADQLSDEEANFILKNGLEGEIREYFRGTDRAREVVLKSISDREGPEVYVVELEPDDEFLLTTDGIHDNLTWDEMRLIMSGDYDLIEDDEVRQAAAFAKGTVMDKLAAAARVRSRQIRIPRVDPGDYPRAKPDDMTAVQVLPKAVARPAAEKAA